MMTFDQAKTEAIQGLQEHKSAVESWRDQNAPLATTHAAALVAVEREIARLSKLTETLNDKPYVQD